MAITGVTQIEYDNFLKNGGVVTFYIESSDIDPGGGFASSPIIAPTLSSGFELVPSPSPPCTVKPLAPSDPEGHWAFFVAGLPGRSTLSGRKAALDNPPV